MKHHKVTRARGPRYYSRSLSHRATPRPVRIDKSPLFNASVFRAKIAFVGSLLIISSELDSSHQINTLLLLSQKSLVSFYLVPPTDAKILFTPVMPLESISLAYVEPYLNA
jgi:hypothetical protein